MKHNVELIHYVSVSFHLTPHGFSYLFYSMVKSINVFHTNGCYRHKYKDYGLLLCYVM